MSKEYFKHWMTVQYAAHAFESCDFTADLESLSADELKNRTYVSENFLRWLPRWMNESVHPSYRTAIKKAIPYLCVLQERQDAAWGYRYGQIYRELEVESMIEENDKYFGNGTFARKSN